MSLDLIELNICFRNTKCTEYFYFFLKNFLNIYFLLFLNFLYTLEYLNSTHY